MVSNEMHGAMITEILKYDSITVEYPDRVVVIKVSNIESVKYTPKDDTIAFGLVSGETVVRREFMKNFKPKRNLQERIDDYCRAENTNANTKKSTKKVSKKNAIQASQ